MASSIRISQTSHEPNQLCVHFNSLLAFSAKYTTLHISNACIPQTIKVAQASLNPAFNLGDKSLSKQIFLRSCSALHDSGFKLCADSLENLPQLEFGPCSHSAIRDRFTLQFSIFSHTQYVEDKKVLFVNTVDGVGAIEKGHGSRCKGFEKMGLIRWVSRMYDFFPRSHCAMFVRQGLQQLILMIYAPQQFRSICEGAAASSKPSIMQSMNGNKFSLLWQKGACLAYLELPCVSCCICLLNRIGNKFTVLYICLFTFQFTFSLFFLCVCVYVEENTWPLTITQLFWCSPVSYNLISNFSSSIRADESVEQLQETPALRLVVYTT